MRIITGFLKGRSIPVPNTGDLRPTADRTKEAIFAVIDARRYFEGCRVLDLFAGSGNLGFEAISRGVSHVTFVESNSEHATAIRRLAAEFDIDSQTTVICRSTEQYLEQYPEGFDLIFSDPPYDYPFMEQILETIIHDGWLNEGGWYILEHDRRHDFSNHSHCFHSKPYGRTVVTMFEG